MKDAYEINEYIVELKCAWAISEIEEKNQIDLAIQSLQWVLGEAEKEYKEEL